MRRIDELETEIAECERAIEQLQIVHKCTEPGSINRIGIELSITHKLWQLNSLTHTVSMLRRIAA